jgi:hypothetical protein
MIMIEAGTTDLLPGNSDDQESISSDIVHFYEDLVQEIEYQKERRKYLTIDENKIVAGNLKSSTYHVLLATFSRTSMRGVSLPTVRDFALDCWHDVHGSV